MVDSLCASIESDSALYFMYRLDVQSSAGTECPFQGMHTFSYSTRSGTKNCAQPPSQTDYCTDASKMVLKYQACPDVPGSESHGKGI